MAMPEQARPSALFIISVADVSFASCAAVLPCAWPDMAVADAGWLFAIAMPGVIACAADEEVGPIAAAAVSW
ncbi:hypothetical protein OG416_37270 (plasmid) [Streptomyces longwoodensis]|uniref:hypothetical protein n=1 Tax=Streptomyces longwoodensis TaxID=68231 RepID=UPI0030E12FDE|nr:hypothetical protein OG416_37270 [Streptomyces longwoodensis]